MQNGHYLMENISEFAVVGDTVRVFDDRPRDQILSIWPSKSRRNNEVVGLEINLCRKLFWGDWCGSSWVKKPEGKRTIWTTMIIIQACGNLA